MNASMTTTEITTTDPLSTALVGLEPSSATTLRSASMHERERRRTSWPADVRADREVSAEGMPAIYSKLRLAVEALRSEGGPRG